MMRTAVVLSVFSLAVGFTAPAVAQLKVPACFGSEVCQE